MRGSRAALPAGPRGRPMSEAPRTSPASPPTPWPTWVATIAPVALPSMPSSGPAIARASSGRALPSAVTVEPATGSTRRFQTSRVSTIHSARLQAAVEVTPEEKSVVSSSQWSASRTASAIASCWAWLGVGSGCWAATLRAMSETTAQLMGPSWGCMRDCTWAISAERSGMPPPRRPQAAEEGLEGCALERVLLVGSVAGVAAHALHGTHRRHMPDQPTAPRRRPAPT